MKTSLIPLAIAALLCACSSSVEPSQNDASFSGFTGVWSAEMDDGWTAVFNIEQTDGIEYTGHAASYYKGKLYAVNTITEARVENTTIRFISNQEARVVFEGTLHDDDMSIDGTLHYRNGSTNPLVLSRVTDGSYNGFTPLSSCGEPYRYSIPEQRDDGIATGSLTDAGYSQESLNNFIGAVESRELGELHSLLIAKNGTLVVEEYFYSYTADTAHDLHSCTKSIVSLIAGVLYDKKLLPDGDAPLPVLLPQYATSMGDDVKTITLDNLFTMTAGFPQSNQRFRSNDERAETLFGGTIAYPPGSQFAYDDNTSEIIGAILSSASGSDLLSIAGNGIFTPLGIDIYEWETYTDDTPMCSAGLSLRPRDLLKIGITIINDGIWNGTRIVSDEWIGHSTRSITKTGTPLEYAMHWWIFPGEITGLAQDCIAAQGAGGQRLFILPSLDTVCVITGGNFNSNPPVNPYLLAILTNAQ